MQIEIPDELQTRLHEMAERLAVPVPLLVRQMLTHCLDAHHDQPLTWVQAAQSHLPHVWAAEDFSDWRPPHAHQ